MINSEVYSHSSFSKSNAKDVLGSIDEQSTKARKKFGETAVGKLIKAGVAPREGGSPVGNLIRNIGKSLPATAPLAQLGFFQGKMMLKKGDTADTYGKQLAGVLGGAASGAGLAMDKDYRNTSDPATAAEIGAKTTLVEKIKKMWTDASKTVKIVIVAIPVAIIGFVAWAKSRKKSLRKK